MVWAELAAAAHLTGWGSPRPAPSVLDGLPHRIRDCTVSHAVDAAVASRAAPAGLAAHLVTILRGDACSADEMEFLAAPYRWCLVLEELGEAQRTTSGGGRHPLSGDWESRYGRAVPGETLAEQLRTVNAWWDRDQRDLAARDFALWGSSQALEAAVGALRTDPDWPDRLREATSGLGDLGGLLGSFTTAG